MIVWAATLIVGMLLRLAVGQGVQVAFVIVAAVTLAILLVGWRGVAALVAAAGRRPRDGGHAVNPIEWLFDAQLVIGGQVILWREIVGNLFGLASALGGLRRKVWAWPVGIVGNVLLFTVFLGRGLRHPEPREPARPGESAGHVHRRLDLRLGALVAAPAR